MARGPYWPKHALEGVLDRYPSTPIPSGQRRLLNQDGRGSPLVGIGLGAGTTLQRLQKDQDLVKRVVDLLPGDEVRSAVQSYTHQAGALAEAMGGREMVAAVLHELNDELSREESALLQNELEHELAAPLDDTSDDDWVTRETEHARWELARHWVAQVLAAVERHGPGPVSLDACLRPIHPPGSEKGNEWTASPEEIEDALLASISVKPDGFQALMKSLHHHMEEVVSRQGSFDLPGRVRISRQPGGTLQAAHH